MKLKIVLFSASVLSLTMLSFTSLSKRDVDEFQNNKVLLSGTKISPMDIEKFKQKEGSYILVHSVAQDKLNTSGDQKAVINSNDSKAVSNGHQTVEYILSKYE